jgi:predicted lipoprotein with Yx(FWY)xxD motif
MRSRPIVLAATVVAALSAGGCGTSPGPAGTPVGAGPPTINASYLNQFKAEVLTNGAGFPLYVFQPDHRRAVTCQGSCAAIWPPIFTSADQRTMSGPGVQASLLGSDPSSGKRAVVTYNGWPLYGYVSDMAPGVATGQGLNLNGGYWYVIQPDGKVIVPAGDPPAS